MNDWFHTIFLYLLAALGCALLVATLRLLRGPTITDRIMALDLIAVIIVASIGMSAMAFDITVLLDIAIVIALISFVGTVAFSLFIQKRARL